MRYLYVGLGWGYRSKYRYGVEFAAESFVIQEWGGSFSITEEAESECHMFSEQATGPINPYWSCIPETNW